MQILVGVMAATYLLFSDAYVTRNFLDTLRGDAVLLGMVTAFLLLPLLWRGHSFGQRAMGILVIPAADDNIDELSGATMMFRKLTFQTRSVCAEPMSSRP